MRTYPAHPKTRIWLESCDITRHHCLNRDAETRRQQRVMKRLVTLCTDARNGTMAQQAMTADQWPIGVVWA